MAKWGAIFGAIGAVTAAAIATVCTWGAGSATMVPAIGLAVSVGTAAGTGAGAAGDAKVEGDIAEEKEQKDQEAESLRSANDRFQASADSFGSTAYASSNLSGYQAPRRNARSA